MTELLKDRFFTRKFINDLGREISGIYPDFKQKRFQDLVYDQAWSNMELKQKMNHITRCLAATLPEEYADALKILTEVAPKFSGFDVMVFPDFVEHYGLDHWDISLPALALFTPLCSSEFAIRPFLARDPQKGMASMQKWAGDENFHLRRLASEGCRPRLPWAMALDVFKKDPSLILPILEELKDDPSEYVRKSVANNLNDISKDHPDTVLDLCERWQGSSENTDWVIKHACRTMLKAGNTRALVLFGFGDPGNIKITDLEVDHSTLHIGESLRFTFKMKLDHTEAYKVRLEYRLNFTKSNGKLSGKIFQIREAEYRPGIHSISRKHDFKDLSTRKHYPGKHQISIIVNGVEKKTINLELLAAKE